MPYLTVAENIFMPNDIPPENVLAFMEVARNENPR